jgi:hypothetical protein
LLTPPKEWEALPLLIISLLDELIRKIGDAISDDEGGCESYNSGTKNDPGGAVGHSYMHPFLELLRQKQ